MACCGKVRSTFVASGPSLSMADTVTNGATPPSRDGVHDFTKPTNRGDAPEP